MYNELNIIITNTYPLERSIQQNESNWGSVKWLHNLTFVLRLNIHLT